MAEPTGNQKALAKVLGDITDVLLRYQKETRNITFDKFTADANQSRNACILLALCGIDINTLTGQSIIPDSLIASVSDREGDFQKTIIHGFLKHKDERTAALKVSLAGDPKVAIETDENNAYSFLEQTRQLLIHRYQEVQFKSKALEQSQDKLTASQQKQDTELLNAMAARQFVEYLNNTDNQSKGTAQKEKELKENITKQINNGNPPLSDQTSKEQAVEIAMQSVTSFIASTKDVQLDQDRSYDQYTLRYEQLQILFKYLGSAEYTSGESGTIYRDFLDVPYNDIKDLLKFQDSIKRQFTKEQEKINDEITKYTKESRDLGNLSLINIIALLEWLTRRNYNCDSCFNYDNGTCRVLAASNENSKVKEADNCYSKRGDKYIKNDDWKSNEVFYTNALDLLLSDTNVTGNVNPFDGIGVSSTQTQSATTPTDSGSVTSSNSLRGLRPPSVVLSKEYVEGISGNRKIEYFVYYISAGKALTEGIYIVPADKINSSDNFLKTCYSGKLPPKSVSMSSGALPQGISVYVATLLTGADRHNGYLRPYSWTNVDGKNHSQDRVGMTPTGETVITGTGANQLIAAKQTRAR